MPRVRPLSPNIRRRAPLAVLPAALLGAMAIAAPALADAPNTSLDFGSAAGQPASVADTGFTTSLVPAQEDLTKLAFDGAGALDVTSTVGTATTQANGLMVKGAPRSGSYYVESVVHPAGGAADFAAMLTRDNQEAGIFVGDSGSNFVKIVAQEGSGGTRIEFFKTGTTGRRVPVTLTGVTCIRFSLQVNTVAKVVTGRYSINCDGTNKGMGYYPLTGVGPGGSANMGAGILTSNVERAWIPTPITAAFDSFTVDADPTTDITPPLLVGQTPAAAVTGVPTDTSVQATFNEKMDLSTITNATFTVAKTSGGAPVAAGAPTGDNVPAQPVFTLTPSAPLDAGTQYTVKLQGLADINGNPLPTTTWTFTTAAVPTPPSGGGGSTPPPAGGGTTTPVPTPISAPAGGLTSDSTGGGTSGSSTTNTTTALKASFSLGAKRVKAGGKGKITLRFNQSPQGSQVIVQRKSGTRFTAILRGKASKSPTVLQFPVGRKLGTFTFRASYRDGGVTRLTAPFSLTVVK